MLETLGVPAPWCETVSRQKDLFSIYNIVLRLDFTPPGGGAVLGFSSVWETGSHIAVHRGAVPLLSGRILLQPRFQSAENGKIGGKRVASLNVTVPLHPYEIYCFLVFRLLSCKLNKRRASPGCPV